jgi:3-(3-hydroxy-phenyl)propionate hydroxylase
MNLADSSYDSDVVIVGGGPVGLTLANLLGQHGLRVLVLERERQLPDLPRAVALDDECLRIWQQCGLIDEILPFVAQGEDGDRVFTYRSATGKEIFSLRQQGRPYGYARGNVFLYHAVLAVLLAGLKRFSRVDYRPGFAVTDCAQSAGGAVVSGRDRAGEEQSFSAPFVVACDGGQSRIRTQLGIELQGMAYRESWLIVDTFSAALRDQPLREGVEVWCDARFPTATIPLPGGYRRWEFLLREGQTPGGFSDADIRALIARRKQLGDLQVVRNLVHTYKAKIASTYRRDRVFLAGDAAHLSPPFAGQGMATGLRDAANLSWKLAQVQRGRESAELLASYELERRPHQQKMLQLALRLGRMMMPRTPVHAQLNYRLFALAGKIAPLRRKLEARGQNVTPVYAIPGAVGRSGQLLPQPRLADGRAFDALLGADYTLLCFAVSPTQLLTETERSHWDKRGLSCVQLSAQGNTAAAYQVFDDWLGGCAGRGLIVRPDRFVCAEVTQSVQEKQ